MSQRDRIKVVCRIHPENKIEKEGNYQKCVQFDNLNISVTVIITNFMRNLFEIMYFLQCNPESKVSDMAGTHNFAFDRVFGP